MTDQTPVSVSEGGAFAALRWTLVVNASLLAAAVAWLWSTPASYGSVERLLQLSPTLPRTLEDGGLAVGAVVAASTLLLGSVGLLTGPRTQRSIAGYLYFTAIVCGWLVLATEWETVYGWGQKRRVAADLDAFAATAGMLEAEWPSEDGSTGDFGPYLAYPKRSPTCLLLLGKAYPLGGSLSVSAVERSAGSIRFELGGDERPAWVVWRPDGALAQPFESGLGGRYLVAKQCRIASHWRLVRYKL